MALLCRRSIIPDGSVYILSVGVDVSDVIVPYVDKMWDGIGPSGC